MVEDLVPLKTSETKGVVGADEFPLPLKEGTAGAVVEYLDPLKEDEVAAAVVVEDHKLGVEEEKEEPPIDVWDDPGEDLWAA